MTSSSSATTISTTTTTITNGNANANGTTTSSLSSTSSSATSSSQSPSLISLDPLHGATMATASSKPEEWMVVRNMEVHIYSLHQSHYHFSLPFPIRSVHRFYDYLLVITNDPLLERDTITLYYLPESLCVYQAHFNQLQFAIPLFRTGLFLFPSESTLRIRELPLRHRLNVLLTNEFYTLAIRLSKDDPELHGKYGDYLIQHHQEADALPHYFYTLGHWDTSKVLRKLKQPKHLIQFLQWIHENNQATQDHTQLLFQCLIQEKNYTELQRLVNNTQVSFDVQTAIQCCAQHELYSLALQLSEKHQQWDLHLDLLLKTNQPKQALLFLNQCTSIQQSDLLQRLGRTLLLASPQPMTQFLIHYVQQTQPKDMLSLIQLYPPHVPELFAFLKFILMDYDMKEEWISNESLWNAFLESAQNLDDALLVLTCSSAKYSIDQALLLCKAHNWIEGLLHIYRQQSRPLEMLEVYQQIGDIENMFLVCKEYHQGKDSYLWRCFLNYLVQSYPRFEMELQQALEYNEKHHVLSMVEVLQLLSQPEFKLPFSVIKQILQKRLESDKKIIEENEKLALSYRQETKKIQEELNACEAGPITFQMTVCTACGETLSLPSIYFICKHSYHARCLNENSKHCLKCYKEHRKLISVKNTLKSSTQDDFFENLHKSEDGFNVVAEWFSKKEIR